MDAKIPQSWQSAIDSSKAWLVQNTNWRLVTQEITADACDVQIVARLVPAKGEYLWPDGPHKANILICNGPVAPSRQEQLLSVADSLPAPRYVIAFGTKAISHAGYERCPDVVGHIDEVLPVAVYLLSYPPQPAALFDGIQLLVNDLRTAHAHDENVTWLEKMSAEVLHRHLERVGGPPSQEEMMRDRHLADRPPY